MYTVTPVIKATGLKHASEFIEESVGAELSMEDVTKDPGCYSMYYFSVLVFSFVNIM
jgi:hypothetical protein